MVKTYQGKLIGRRNKSRHCCGSLNEFITSKLLGGALDALERHGVKENNIEVAWVPGAFEIPLIAQKMAEKDYDAILCLEL